LKVRNTSEYQEISLQETFKLLNAGPDGLGSSEASNRLQLVGYNEVAERRKNPVIQFLRRFWGPMPWLLELAIVLSYIIRHYLETAIIFALLAINAVIGYIQERGSQRALESLKNRLAIKAEVLRDGNWVTVNAREIVPGDIITIGLGDIVPADAKVTDGQISIDQSVLTGESLPVDARQSSTVYSGSIVKRGEARCVAVNTGVNTFFGKTAELVRIAKPKSHQEQIMLAIVRYMMYLGIAALVLVSIYSVLIGTGVLSIITFAVIFLMGAVPVALPAVLTIVQAVGATELVKKGILVTRLDSIEDAASIDVLCMDKTGTITENKLTVADILPFSGYTRNDVIAASSLASQELGNDAIDLAVIEYARAAGTALGQYQQVSFIPFDPSTKRAEAVASVEHKQFRVVKGAPQVIMSICSGINEDAGRQIDKFVEELSLKGFRTLAVARSEGEDLNNLHLVGLLSLADPPRPDSKVMIEEARQLGIKPLMLTGDNMAIAKEIARQVSVGDKIIRMGELNDLSEVQQAKVIEESDGFAEIYPEDKYKIVRLLQMSGHLVGMTGDGVNDAPALKQAEMGIAVSSSTDVAKASASMVLTKPGLRVIMDAIKTSRHIYQRMLTWVINKVTKVIQVIGLLTLGFFWFHDTVVSLLGMALLIFANDFVTMSLATDNVKFTSNPNKWNVKNITLASLGIGLLLVGEGAITLLIGKNYFHLGWEELRTFTMLMLIFTSQFRVYIVRERKYFWSSKPGRELLITTIAAIIAFALLGMYGLIIVPVTLHQVLFILGFSALFTFAIDIPKYLAFKKFGL
jgi:H+-transporting ATPase